MKLSRFALYMIMILCAFAAPAPQAISSDTSDTNDSCDSSNSKAPNCIRAALLDSVQGEVGIAVLDKSQNRRYMLNQEKGFPMQSVCKLPVSIAVLKLVDQGAFAVDDSITITKADFSKYYSPLRDKIVKESSSNSDRIEPTKISIRDLISYAIKESDNTACDVLIARVGGPGAVTGILRSAGVEGVRIDRPEGKLQPDSLKVDEFLDDPRDTASPQCMIEMLEKLYTGKLLSEKSTALILEDLFDCATGAERIRAGLPESWKLAHKTGTGADVEGKNTGTNDVGVAVSPEGRIIYFAIFVKGSKASLAARESLMKDVACRAVSGSLSL